MCKKCNGEKISVKTENIEVPIEVGIPNKSKIVISGKGNEHPDYKTGDLIVIVDIEKDSVFQRHKNDLYLNQKISLIEALSGF